MAAILIPDSGCKERRSTKSTRGQPLNLIWNGISQKWVVFQLFLWTPWGSSRETKEGRALSSSILWRCSLPGTGLLLYSMSSYPLTYGKCQGTAAHSSRMHHLVSCWLRRVPSSHGEEICFSITFSTTHFLSQPGQQSKQCLMLMAKSHLHPLRNNTVSAWWRLGANSLIAVQLSVLPLFLQQAHLQEGPVWLKFNCPTPRGGHHLGQGKKTKTTRLLQASNYRALEIEESWYVSEGPIKIIICCQKVFRQRAACSKYRSI